MLVAHHSASERRRMAHGLFAAVLFFAGLAAAVLYRFPPEAFGFYPLCPVHQYLHLQCPGCGTTRALAALLHGHLGEALRLNALTIGLVLPMAVGYGMAAYPRALRGDRFTWPQLPKRPLYAGFALATVFTVLRNL